MSAQQNGCMRRQRKRTSFVWNHFISNSSKTTATCTLCDVVLKTTKAGTTGLISHLDSFHKIRREETDVPVAITSTPSESICKLAALDGFSFHAIANSETIRVYHKKVHGIELPSSPNTIREEILRYSKSQKQILAQQIQKMKTEGKKFSITLDEWTSLSNRRYMNVNLHFGENFMNLGVARIQNSFTSEACLDILRHKLEEFGVNLDNDILAVVTDGASVMKKFGRISGRYHQLCMAHGIHLAVTDLLYKKPENRVESQFGENSEEMFLFSQNENFASQNEENSENDEISGLEFNEENIEYKESISDIICKVRSTVKFFRLSPLRTETLVKHSGMEECKTLQNDSQTRWNTLVVMLQRVLELKEAILKSYIDFQLVCPLTDPDFDSISNIVKVLCPVKAASEAICRRYATLITADVAITFMFDKLEECQSDLAQELIPIMKRRVTERRTDLSNIASYLWYRQDQYNGHRKGYFSKSSKTQIATCMKHIYEKFHSTTDDPELSNSDTQGSESLLINLGIDNELQLAIRQAENFKHVPNSNRRDTIAEIRNEMRMYEAGGEGGKVISFVRSIIMTLPPSTVESERVFSCTNNFCTKLRSKLKDESLDALAFVKWFFLNLRHQSSR